MEKNNREPILPFGHTDHGVLMMHKKIERLEKENTLLIDALKFYVKEDDGGGKAMITLQQINEGNKE